MSPQFTPAARRFGIASAAIVALLLTAYAVTLTAGLISLDSPDEPITDPLFTILESLIIMLMPAMVALMSAVHTWASPSRKHLTLVAFVFMSLVAGVTSCLHFLILTISRQPAFAEIPTLPLILSFKWPSVAYAVDILAWDLFFPISMLFAAPAFTRGRLAKAVCFLMIVSGLLSLAGLSGIPTNDMQLRNIGIIGYVPAFLAVVVLLGVLFYRNRPTAAGAGEASK